MLLNYKNPTGSKTLRYANFNQKSSHVSFASDEGYELFQCEPFTRKFNQEEEGTGKVEMIFDTAAVILIGSVTHPVFSGRDLRLVNTVTNTIAKQLAYPTTILNVKVNKRRMVVILEAKILIYDMEKGTIPKMETIETSLNEHGLCCLTPGRSSIMVYACGNHLFAYNAHELRILGKGKIEDLCLSEITCIALSNDGSMVALASQAGKNIRVVSLKEDDSFGMVLFKFRRGNYTSTIHSLAFSPNCDMLCAASDTIRLYSLEGEEPQSYTSLIGGYFVEQAFAYIKSITPTLSPPSSPSFGESPEYVEKQKTRYLCSFNPTGTHLLVITDQGIFRKFKIPSAGECELEEE